MCSFGLNVRTQEPFVKVPARSARSPRGSDGWGRAGSHSPSCSTAAQLVVAHFMVSPTYTAGFRWAPRSPTRSIPRWCTAGSGERRRRWSTATQPPRARVKREPSSGRVAPAGARLKPPPIVGVRDGDGAAPSLVTVGVELTMTWTGGDPAMACRWL